MNDTASKGRPVAVVLLSGGLDSMVTAGIAREAGFAIHALTIDYGQRHRCEIGYAAGIARHLEVARHVTLPLDLTKFGGSALTDEPPSVPARLHITPEAAELGPACDQCGGMMQRTGSCYTCSSCGNNTGCG